jgi:hypothetical protein
MSEKKTNRSCEEAQEHFVGWMDEDLSPQFRAALEEHLGECPHCAIQWEGYRATVALLRSLEPVSVSGRVLEGVRTRLHRPSIAERLLAWLVPVPRRVPAPVLATVAALLVMVGVWQWGPWMSPGPAPSSSPLTAVQKAFAPREVVTASEGSLPFHRILPGAEELWSPVRALESDLDRPLTRRAMLQDDMVLDLTGSEEVFQQMEGMLREVHGKMFIMGVRHRGTGEVIRSRVLVQVPFNSYEYVVHHIESLGQVQRLFLDREAIPLPPDRLRIRVVAVDSGLGHSVPPLQAVSWD